MTNSSAPYRFIPPERMPIMATPSARPVFWLALACALLFLLVVSL